MSVAAGGPACAPGPLAMAGWVAALVATQMVMLVYTKKATSRHQLPLVICIAQFATSAVLAAAASKLRRGVGRGLPWMPRELCLVIGPLSAVWTAGFVFFNASASLMSPALVSLVRCMEPLATVAVGCAVGERYSARVLATLVPICGGVALASFRGGAVSLAGVALASLSNLSFCGRPFFTQQLKTHPRNHLDDIGVFFNTCCVSVALLPAFVVFLEGPAAASAFERLAAEGTLFSFAFDVMVSSFFFFLYQLTQLMVMSMLTPLAFSVLTPVVKAFMIVACSLYFGDPFGLLSAAGVAISTGGGYLFTLAKSADTRKRGDAAAAVKKD